MIQIDKMKLEKFLSSSRISIQENKIFISDGVDINYCLEQIENQYKISLTERGREVFKQFASDKSLAIAYYILFVKYSFSDKKYKFLKEVPEVKDLASFLKLLEEAELSDYFAVDNLKPFSIILISEVNEVFFYDGNNKYNIRYLPSRLYIKLYTELTVLKDKLNWLEEIGTIFDLNIPKHAISSLLGYDDSIFITETIFFKNLSNRVNEELKVGILDSIGVVDDHIELLLVDPVDWQEEIEAIHLETLQEKINNYIYYIETKQYVERYGDNFDKKVINITFQYSPSDNSLAFLAAVQKTLKDTDMSLKVILPD